MADSLETLKAELERFGQANDAATNERPRRMLNITRDTGEFLVVLVRATAARRVLEIGTSNGYSTLWLADALGMSSYDAPYLWLSRKLAAELVTLDRRLQTAGAARD